MGQVAAGVAEVRAKIDAACDRSGRSPDEVRLMAVTKTHPVEVLQQAYDAGCRLFGENKVQEAVGKATDLADLSDLSWAFIGHLQTNKTRDVAGFASEFHALDSVKLARTLERHLDETGRTLDVFLEVNSSGEESKFGLEPAAVEEFAVQLRPFEHLRVRGLMTLAVFSDEESEVRACFQRMRDLQERLRNLAAAPGSYDELSMGMSGDYELAIEYGATTVRVGQAIFGARRAPATAT
jgi:pyridoxal phosphate enzyme (YggS family)